MAMIPAVFQCDLCKIEEKLNQHPFQALRREIPDGWAVWNQYHVCPNCWQNFSNKIAEWAKNGKGVQ